MNKKTLKFIAGIAAGTIAITTLVFLPNNKIKFCDNDSCSIFSQQDYEKIKNELMIKVDNKSVLSWNEYQLYIKIMDFEIKKKGGVQIMNANNDNVLKKINEEIRKNAQD